MRALVIQSSSINALAYDQDLAELFILFRSGKWYKYEDVSGEAVLEILFAESSGKVFDAIIKQGGYAFEEVSAEDYHLHV